MYYQCSQNELCQLITRQSYPIGFYHLFPSPLVSTIILLSELCGSKIINIIIKKKYSLFLLFDKPQFILSMCATFNNIIIVIMKYYFWAFVAIILDGWITRKVCRRVQ